MVKDMEVLSDSYDVSALYKLVSYSKSLPPLP